MKPASAEKLNILLLGPHGERIEKILCLCGDRVQRTDSALDGTIDLKIVDFIISYGYRHIIKKDVVEMFKGRAINLHCSLLPWNRGADPNLWSFLENTPRGVTIHLIDSGVDTGDIIAQDTIDALPGDTLRTSYDRLSKAIEELFIQKWADIRAGKIKAVPQPGGGSFHRLKDRLPFEHLLTKGWDTPVAELLGKAVSTKA